MTPEERFMMIENTLRHSDEIQARLMAGHEQHEAEIRMVTAGVRDLVVVSRTLIDSQKAADERVAGLTVRFDSLADQVKENENARRRANEEFDVKFAALIQAQMETERMQKETQRTLNDWIRRQGGGRG